MRMTWFSGSHVFGRRVRGRRHSAANRLRVRQLERRRVLDGAVQSLVTSVVIAKESTDTATASPASDSSETTNYVPQQPFGFNWAPMAGDAAVPGEDASQLAQGAVVNVPPFLVVPLDQSANEGQLLDLSGTNGAPPIGLFIDLDLADTHTATVDWGDGSPVESPTLFQGIGAGALGASHVYAVEGTFTVTISVMDNNGGSDTDSFLVDVANVAPSLVVQLDQTIDEGQLLDLSGTNGAPPLGLFIDPGLLDTHTATVNWGDGSATENATIFQGLGAGALGGSHTYADDGIYTVTVSVADGDGGSDTKTFHVAVGNVAPFADLTGPSMVNEGSLNSWMIGPVIDPGADTVSQVVVHWGDGNTDSFTPLQLAGQGGMVSHLYADGDANRTITIDLVDEDGSFLAVDSLNVMVKNVPPSLVVPLAQNVFEGDLLDLSGTNGAPPLGLFIDPGLLDTHIATVYWGDGSATENATIIQGIGAGALGGTHVYADDGVYQVTVTVTDNNGGSDSKSFLVTVANKNPVVLTPRGDQNMVEGDTISFGDLATFTDAGFDNANNTNPFQPPAVGDPLAESFTYDIDWGDGTGAITGMTLADTNGGPGVPSSGTIAGSHTYADDGVYQVTVTVYDDNGGIGTKSFFVTVNNVAPSLTDTAPGNTVAEGRAFVLSNLGGATPNLGIGLSDPGFDNAANTNPFSPPAVGDPLAETFTGYTIDWGDGTTDTPVTVVMRTSGGPGVPTTALFDHAAHTYADDGVYTVRVRVADDNMTGDFAGGTNGVDFIDLTFQITVTNVAPTMVAPVPTAALISENGSVSFTASFSDPGFDNPLNDNVPPNGGEKAETFTYDVDWGDGRQTVSGASAASATGSPGVLTTGSFGENHVYADDGVYTVTITVYDDDGGSDVRTLQVTVQNTDPIPVLPLEGDDVTSGGTTRIRLSFSDWGFDNPLNPTPPPTGEQFAESFTYTVDWGDGTVDTITVTPLAPGNTIIINGQTTVLASTRVTGDEGVMSTGSFEVEHRYFGPPDPLHPTADIPITVTLADDNGGSFTQTVLVGNPGIQEINVAIDTTPDVARLEYVPQQLVHRLLDRQSGSMLGQQSQSARVANSEMSITSERYLELVVISPEGKEVLRYRLKDEAISNLRGLFATLPENHYKIYLVRTADNSRRLVVDVVVRNGRVIDPNDDTEGTRDRPPMESGEKRDVQPLNANPLLEQQPAEKRADGPQEETSSTEAGPMPAADVAVDVARASADDMKREVPRTEAWRWAVPLAGLGLVAARGNWSREVEEAFDQADRRAWQRLRRAGRVRGRRSGRGVVE
ncbi:MAG: hypothetical protein IT425_12555 [Pirellulales bacterium]|nr:hypothetical protein [Pirellulales bacterium]